MSGIVGKHRALVVTKCVKFKRTLKTFIGRVMTKLVFYPPSSHTYSIFSDTPTQSQNFEFRGWDLTVSEWGYPDIDFYLVNLKRDQEVTKVVMFADSNNEIRTIIRCVSVLGYQVPILFLSCCRSQKGYKYHHRSSVKDLGERTELRVA